MKFIPMTLHYLRYSTKKWLDKFEQSPFDSFDLYMSAPQLNAFDYPLGDLIELDRELRRRKLSVYSITPENCTYPCNFGTQNRETRESSLRYYQRVIDTAQYLGCPNVQISTGFGYFDAPAEEAWSHVQDSLVLLTEYAKRKNICLFLEENKNTTTQVLVYASDVAKMLAEVNADNLTGMLDTDQMVFSGETIEDYFQALGKKMGYVHFVDRAHLVPGDGDYNLEKIYKDLKRNGYDGVCCFEIMDRRYFQDPDAAIDGCIEWLKKNTDEYKDYTGE